MTDIKQNGIISEDFNENLYVSFLMKMNFAGRKDGRDSYVFFLKALRKKRHRARPVPYFFLNLMGVMQCFAFTFLFPTLLVIQKSVNDKYKC